MDRDACWPSGKLRRTITKLSCEAGSCGLPASPTSSIPSTVALLDCAVESMISLPQKGSTSKSGQDLSLHSCESVLLRVSEAHKASAPFLAAAREADRSLEFESAHESHEPERYGWRDLSACPIWGAPYADNPMRGDTQCACSRTGISCQVCGCRSFAHIVCVMKASLWVAASSMKAGIKAYNSTQQRCLLRMKTGLGLAYWHGLLQAEASSSYIVGPARDSADHSLAYAEARSSLSSGQKHPNLCKVAASMSAAPASPTKPAVVARLHIAIAWCMFQSLGLG